ncbi:MAG: 4Fe-4S dicluster domain-containing protein [Promethearchaeia archaeon]
MKSATKRLEQKFKELSSFIYKAITVGECVGCGTCVKFCPLKIRVFDVHKKAKTINTYKTCHGCSVCVKRCPLNAIQLINTKKL